MTTPIQNEACRANLAIRVADGYECPFMAVIEVTR
jgi:hypothetical protein